jgi:hypothetical protein
MTGILQHLVTARSKRNVAFLRNHYELAAIRDSIFFRDVDVAVYVAFLLQLSQQLLLTSVKLSAIFTPGNCSLHLIM